MRLFQYTDSSDINFSVICEHATNMNTETEQRNQRENEPNTRPNTLNLDGILATQPELGPSIPDGGCGWVVFVGTLFFQALIPCLIVNLGIFLAISKLQHGTAGDKNVILWDDKLLYVLLFYSISRTFFDATTRSFAAKTTSPRLMAVAGTCQTCAGLLFVWMGMTGEDDDWLYVPAGICSGLGASTLLVQCEIILAQYFKLKLPGLNQISRFVVSLGFLIAPVTLGHYLLSTSSISQVLLWYQAIILQGLVVSLLFRKPQYLKSKAQKPYQFIISPDEEEDIFSKNSRELQIKRQTENHVTKIEINNDPQPSTSNGEDRQKWETFEDEEVKYDKLKQDWETFDDEEEIAKAAQTWERFDDDGSSSPRIINNLSLAEETREEKSEEDQPKNIPSPLFSDLPVNNNNTYSYDEELVETPTHNVVFMPTAAGSNNRFKRHLDLLKQPTFYKTLLMAIANAYSFFVFYALYPSYLYIQADSLNIRHMTGLIGALALVNLFYVLVSFWVKVNKDKKPLCYWIFYWVGSVGYFMIADFTNEYVLLIGAVQVVLSIVVLEHTGRPLFGVSMRGETSVEHHMFSMISGLALGVFLFLDVTFKTCFRLVAVMHFFTGTLWLSNFAYKKLRAY